MQYRLNKAVDDRVHEVKSVECFDIHLGVFKLYLETVNDSNLRLTVAETYAEELSLLGECSELSDVDTFSKFIMTNFAGVLEDGVIDNCVNVVLNYALNHSLIK